MVFVRSLINPHGLWGRLIFAHAHEYELWLSAPVLQEILEVLERPVLKTKYRTSAIELQRLFRTLETATLVEVGAAPPASRDPKDDKCLATAHAAAADYLVSEDNDLLVLGSYEGTKIVNTATFLAALESERDEHL
jgi:putative PIN family toxin of toxin-antitoxin system